MNESQEFVVFSIPIIYLPRVTFSPNEKGLFLKQTTFQLKITPRRIRKLNLWIKLDEGNRNGISFQRLLFMCLPYFHSEFQEKIWMRKNDFISELMSISAKLGGGNLNYNRRRVNRNMLLHCEDWLVNVESWTLRLALSQLLTNVNSPTTKMYPIVLCTLSIDVSTAIAYRLKISSANAK